MMKLMLLGAVLVALLAGCGQNLVGLPEQATTPALNNRADPHQIPPTKLEHWYDGEPTDVDLGPVG